MNRTAGYVHAMALSVVVGALATPASAQLRAEMVAEGFQQPLLIAPDPSAPGTLIVVEQRGLAHAVVNGTVQPIPFVDIQSDVKFETEQGMLGLAFSPDGTRVFVSFVKKRIPDLGTGDIVLARFRRSADPLVLDPSSRFDFVWPGGQRVITQPTPVHKGGNLAFGPDGYLYFGLGDGGGGGDPVLNAQNPALLPGKMLRLDVGVPDADPRGYAIPPGNPFVDGVPIPAQHEIWAFGYRNPWRFSFDDYGTGATGAMIVGDVGQDTLEEIDYEPAGQGGRNYGWYLREGTIPTPGVSPLREPAYEPLTEPLAVYPRSIGRSVTGGFVYRGSALPFIYSGRYFVADYFGGVYSVGLAHDGAGNAQVTDVMEHAVELGNPRLISTFGRGLDGELYFASYIGGRIYKIVPDTPPLPAPPLNFTTRVEGSTVTLSWQPDATGGPVLAYQLEAGSQSGSSDLLVTESAAASMVVPGVPAGLYFVRVRALNSSGLSEPSAEMAVRVGCGGPPVAPSGLNAVVSSGGVVSLTWNAVSDATSYLVVAGSAPGLSDLASIPVASPSISGAVASDTYFVRVHALTPCGMTPASNEAVAVVP